MLRLTFGGIPVGPGRKARGPSSIPPLARTLVPLLLCLVVVGAFAKSFLFRGSAGRDREAAARPDPVRPAGFLREPQITVVPDPGDEDEPGTPVPTGARRAEPPAAVVQDPGGAVPPAAPPADPAAAAPAEPTEGGPPAPAHAPFAPYKEDPALLEAIEDDASYIEPDALYHLMWKVRATAAETVRAEAREVAHATMRDAPKTLRGKAVRARGRLLRLEPEATPWHADQNVNPSGVRWPYWGVIADQAFRTVQFFTPDFPPGLEVRDVVEIEGYFVKVWKFESATGATTRAPVMIVKTIRRIESRDEEKKGMTWVGWVVLGFLVLSVPVFVVYLRRERARYLVFRQEQMKRRREEFQGAGAPPGPGAAGSPPPAATSASAPPPPPVA